MNAILAAGENSLVWLGMLAAAAFTVGLIINVASLHTKDMNRKSGHATTLLFLALILEAASWTVRGFGGGNESGVFWVIVAAATLHTASAACGLRAVWEHHTIGRWPHGRRRALLGFWLNVLVLLALAGWFYLGEDPKLYQRLFD